MKILRYIVRHNKITLILAIIISFASGISSAALIALISQQLTSQEPIRFTFIGYLVVLILVVLLMELIAKWMLIRFTAWNTYHLRMHLSQQILVTDLPRLEEFGPARLLALLTEDVVSIARAINQIPTLCISIAVMMAGLVYLAWLSSSVLFVLILLTVPAIFGHWIFQQKGKQAFAQALELRDQRFEYYRALTEGIKELKLHRLRSQSFLHELLEPVTMACQKKLISGRIWYEVATTWSQSLYFIFIIGIFALATIRQTNLEVLTGYALVVLYLKSYVTRLLSALPHWYEAKTTLKKIESMGFSLEALEEKVEIQKQSISTPLCLELTGITHTYRRELDEIHFTLGPLDFSLSSGELVFLTGGNGSGKTTLIKLLLGLYIPEKGRIELNDIPVTDDMLESYRQNFSVIFSDFYLFEQLLGFPNPNFEQQAQDYLIELQLEHKVKIVDGHFSTTNLSMGQRKRLALLTAYLEDRPIYIFDEWAAGQDPTFKEIFYRQLLPELKAKGKLIIVVSHDDQYFNVADRIIKLNHGQIEEDTCFKLE